MDKLRCVDDAFRRQLESVQAAHQAELLQLSNEKQKHIEQANLKVKYGFYFFINCLSSRWKEQELQHAIFVWERQTHKLIQFFKCNNFSGSYQCHIYILKNQ